MNGSGVVVFGFSLRDLVRAMSELIAGRMGRLCWRRLQACEEGVKEARNTAWLGLITGVVGMALAGSIVLGC